MSDEKKLHQVSVGFEAPIIGKGKGIYTFFRQGLGDLPEGVMQTTSNMDKYDPTTHTYYVCQDLR